MTCEEILDHAIAMLQRRGRPTYGTLKRQFQTDSVPSGDRSSDHALGACGQMGVGALT